MFPKLLLALTVAITLIGCNKEKEEKSKIDSAINVPADQKILLFMGQDNGTIDEYTSSIDYPITGFTLYIGVGDEMKGFYDDVNWGAGKVNFSEMLKKHPTQALAIGVHMGGIIGPDTAVFAEKKAHYTKVIKKFIGYVQKDPLLTNRQIFFRLAYEVEAPWFGHNPKDVAKAFKIAKEEFTAAGLKNVALVWQLASNPTLKYSPEMLEDWYPGDEYVDWVGLSTFYFDASYDKAWSCAKDQTKGKKPSEIYNLIMDFSRKHQKPVLIAESTPQSMNTKAGTVGCTWGGQDKEVEYPKNVEKIGQQQIWDTWYKEYFSFIYGNKDVIRGVAYINTDWDLQNMWACKKGHCPVGYWGNASIQDSELIKKNWLAEIKKDIWVAPK